MAKSYFTDQVFKQTKSIESGDYENCRFVNCVLPKCDLSGINFIECEFEHCDFSSSKLHDTAFKTVAFDSSKLVGLCFEDCNEFLFSIDFKDCNLNLSSFYRVNPQNLSFKNCNLKEVDFTEAELNEVIFDNCDLASAIFKNTNLVKAGLRTSYNFLIDPEWNNIKKSKFSLQGLPGLLQKYNIHIE
jgi:uncharacterized protein YjbI with pentapeptide repeats